MAAIDPIISVNITASTTAVSTESFAIPLIVGTDKGTGDVAVATYSAPGDMLDDGYEEDDAAYQYAVALCSQAIKPAVFKVAKRSASGSIGDDIAAIAQADDSWYGAVFAGLSDTDIVAAATAIEGMTKIALFASSSAGIAGTGTTDVLSQLGAKGLSRSALIYSPESADNGVDAGLLGGQLPKQPGSCSWAYKTIQGVTVDALSQSAISAVAGTPITGTFGKKGNVFVTLGGVNVLFPGVMANGTFIDLKIGTDSLTSVIKTNILQALVSNDKIPYTEGGCTIIESCIRAAIATHQGYGFLDTDPATVSVTHTPVFNVSATQRVQRIAPPFKFACRTTGAIHAVSITGTINI